MSGSGNVAIAPFSVKTFGAAGVNWLIEKVLTQELVSEHSSEKGSSWTSGLRAGPCDKVNGFGDGALVASCVGRPATVRLSRESVW